MSYEKKLSAQSPPYHPGDDVVAEPFKPTPMPPQYEPELPVSAPKPQGEDMESASWARLFQVKKAAVIRLYADIEQSAVDARFVSLVHVARAALGYAYSGNRAGATQRDRAPVAKKVLEG